MAGDIPPINQPIDHNELYNPDLYASVIAQMTQKLSKNEFKPYLKCCLGNVRLYALLDSGNTLGNAISEKLAELLLGRKFLTHLKPVHTTVGTAQKGARLHLLGRTIKPLTLSFGQKPHSFKTFPLVIKGLNSDLNLSGPFFTKHHIDLLYSKNAISVDNQLINLNSRRTLPPKIIQSIQIAQMNSNAYQATYAAKIAQDELLYPNSAKFVQVKCEPMLPPNVTGTLEVSPTFMEKYPCLPARNVLATTNSEGLLTTSIMNLQDENLELYSNSYFGDFYPDAPQSHKTSIQHLHPLHSTMSHFFQCRTD